MRWLSNGTYLYLFDGLYEVENPSDPTVTKYYAIAGMTIAMDDGTSLVYFLTDHLGSIIAVLDDDGTILSEQRYLPFGKVRTDLGPATQTDFGYTFQRNLPQMGLMDYKARFYDPIIGKFIQPDSLIGGNRYAYVGNNPINLIDPTGNDLAPFPTGPVPSCGDSMVLDNNLKCVPYTPGGDSGAGLNAKDEPNSSTSSSDDISNFPSQPIPGAEGSAFRVCPKDHGYVQCFYYGGIMLFDDEINNLDPSEFILLLIALYFDLQAKGQAGMLEGSWGDINQRTFDTPFFDGSKWPGSPYQATVCIFDMCSQNYEVNYVGQGMISAARNDSIITTIGKVIAYKGVQYGQLPFESNTEQSIAWAIIGYYSYKQLDKMSVNLYEKYKNITP